MASIIKSDGSTERIALLKGNAQLNQLQTIVGGYIEHVRLQAHVGNNFSESMWVNEDGYRLNLQHNALASEIARVPVVGDVVLTYPGEVD
jgi:hypothetical protein